jgi:hypothetical protein
MAHYYWTKSRSTKVRRSKILVDSRYPDVLGASFEIGIRVFCQIGYDSKELWILYHCLTLLLAMVIASQTNTVRLVGGSRLQIVSISSRFSKILRSNTAGLFFVTLISSLTYTR